MVDPELSSYFVTSSFVELSSYFVRLFKCLFSRIMDISDIKSHIILTN